MQWTVTSYIAVVGMGVYAIELMCLKLLGFQQSKEGKQHTNKITYEVSMAN